ncbi:uncharacterized protein EI97DRAFT_461562 [Westerdykella ornata]|uniref:Uncharacterized protein n=1 Tax=Westerdykella ornata TaxID=318751 RepID=A0A6A6JCN4_WESOR|nr:uncharacterized protein EI97DRAFT_461562 [Westerdykella ornata]KAF2272949.1 hypothetical protein EI97DRAFT_461562 [Westerdykella ornata]
MNTSPLSITDDTACLTPNTAPPVCKVLDHPFRLVVGTTSDGSMITFEYVEADDTFPFFFQEVVWRKWNKHSQKWQLETLSNLIRTEPEAVIEFIGDHVWVVDINMCTTRFAFTSLHKAYAEDPGNPAFWRVEDPAGDMGVDALLATLGVNGIGNDSKACQHFIPFQVRPPTPEDPLYIGNLAQDGEDEKVTDQRRTWEPASPLPAPSTSSDESQHACVDFPMEVTNEELLEGGGWQHAHPEHHLANSSSSAGDFGYWNLENGTSSTESSHPVDAQCQLLPASPVLDAASGQCSFEDATGPIDDRQVEDCEMVDAATLQSSTCDMDDVRSSSSSECDLFDPRFDTPPEEEEYSHFSEDE